MINYAKIEFLIYIYITFHYSNFYSFKMQCDQCNDDLPNQIFYFLLHVHVHTQFCQIVHLSLSTDEEIGNK